MVVDRQLLASFELDFRIVLMDVGISVMDLSDP